MTAQAPITAGIETGGGTWRFPASQPLRLDSGATLAPLEIAYKTYGALNDDRTNAVLVCHALTGDQHVASTHPVTGKPGWWDRFVGPGQAAGPRALLHHLHQRRRRLHGHRPGPARSTRPPASPTA